MLPSLISPHLFPPEVEEIWYAPFLSGNTKFFYLSNVIRCKKNHIQAIKLDSRNRIYTRTSRQEITLHGSSQSQFPSDLEGLFDLVITPQENINVTKIPDMIRWKIVLTWYPCRRWPDLPQPSILVITASMTCKKGDREEILTSLFNV